MSLAQLFDGQQSLQLYQQGIAIITKRKSKAENSTENQPDLSRDLSSAFCAIADLFMTDLCDDPEAEVQCTKAIEEAIKNEENNPEAWQTKARLELIKSQFEVKTIKIIYWMLASKRQTKLMLRQNISLATNLNTFNVARVKQSRDYFIFQNSIFRMLSSN